MNKPPLLPKPQPEHYVWKERFNPVEWLFAGFMTGIVTVVMIVLIAIH